MRRNKVALDLLIKMCEVDPEKRISAEDCLRHRFFTDLEDHEMIIENSESERKPHHFENYQAQKQMIFNMKNNDMNSLVIRNPVINGKMDTV